MIGKFILLCVLCWATKCRSTYRPNKIRWRMMCLDSYSNVHGMLLSTFRKIKMRSFCSVVAPIPLIDKSSPRTSRSKSRIISFLPSVIQGCRKIMFSVMSICQGLPCDHYQQYTHQAWLCPVDMGPQCIESFLLRPSPSPFRHGTPLYRYSLH